MQLQEQFVGCVAEECEPFVRHDDGVEFVAVHDKEFPTVRRHMHSFAPDLHTAEVEACELPQHLRSEEQTSELQSLMRISYAVSCLTKKTQLTGTPPHHF